MFYCYDNSMRYGLIDYDPSLISHWERSRVKLKKTWNMAVMAAISDRRITYFDLKIYEQKFKKVNKKLSR